MVRKREREKMVRDGRRETQRDTRSDTERWREYGEMVRERQRVCVCV